jgi:hypothetical protein
MALSAEGAALPVERPWFLPYNNEQTPQLLASPEVLRKEGDGWPNCRRLHGRTRWQWLDLPLRSTDGARECKRKSFLCVPPQCW